MTIVIEDEETEYTFQQVAREQFILKMLQEIAFDMEVCKLKGWDVMEYPRRIFDEVARVVLKYRQTTRCTGKPYKDFNPSPQCGNCDAYVGFYNDKCPNCGAILDRSNIERVEIKDE